MSKKTISDKLAELQEIIAGFESDSLEVEAALERFERGSKLSEEIRAELAELKTKVTVLKDRFDQE